MLALGMNVTIVAVVLFVGEVALRMLVVHTSIGEKLGSLALASRMEEGEGRISADSRQGRSERTVRCC